MADHRIKREISFRPLNNGDFETIWKEYKAGSFRISEGMEKLEFSIWFEKIRSRYQEVLMVAVEGKSICFVCSYFNGWKYEPHVEFFSSANKRDILEATISFFKKLKDMDTIGVVVVKSLDQSTGLFDHVSRRGCLEYVGKIPKGDYRGTEHIYTVSGNALRPVATRTPTEGRI